MRSETKVTAAVAVVVLAVLLAYVVVQATTSEEPASAAESAGVLVRDDSHRLGTPAPDDEVVLVEFLDLECESCRAVFPFVEQLRETYEGRVTFVLRYFPLPGHANAENAAWAVEAAAQQDALEPMYQRMYQTQAQWGERQDSQAALFRTFADDLGLDLDRYDADVASTTTRERVARDYEDGLALGVSGTPTFFLDGRQLRPSTPEDFTAAIDAALAD
ncbi:MAG: thioredoxin domain-containing protein [Nocardioidaceae bacterium]|nr:thioredoxin domain-containing protein [Nocardioidaceae bacterium]